MSKSPQREGDDVRMDSEGDDNAANPSFKPFTKAERIQQLNDIDKSITQLLRSAGLAIKTLTILQNPSQTKEGERQAPPTDFPSATDTYLNELHSVDVRLKRQIHGLVEAGIITQESQSVLGKPEGQSQDSSRIVADRGWDVGWLNTRSGKVGRDMEAELWANAKAFLEGLEKEQNGGKKAMEVDDDSEMAE